MHLPKKHSDWKPLITGSLTLVLFLGIAACNFGSLEFHKRSPSGSFHQPDINESPILPILATLNSPSDFRANVLSNSQIIVSWTDLSTNEDGFRVERSSDFGSSFHVLANAPINSSFFIDGTISLNSSYLYRLSAYKGSVSSTYSYVQITTPTLRSPLTAPTLQSVVAQTSETARLTWTDSNTEESGTVIQRAGSGDFVEIARVNAGVTLFEDYGRSPEGTYRYRVGAFDATTSSPWSTELAVTMPARPIAPPGSLSASIAGTQDVRLAWADGGGEKDGFKIERSSEALPFNQIATIDAQSVFYQDSGLAPGTYHFRIRAYKGNYHSEYSNGVTIIVSPVITEPLRAPSFLIATASSATEVRLSWIENSTSETGIRVERSLDGAAFFDLINLPENSTGYVDSSVQANTAYFYRLIAFDSNQSSIPSNVASVSMPVPFQLLPLSLSAVLATATSIQLEWGNQNNSSSTGFRLERKTGNGVAFELLTLSEIGITHYTDSSLSPGTTYSYRVREIEGNQVYPYSVLVTISTPAVETVPSLPSGLVAEILSSREVKLNWNDNSNDETGFRLERSTADGSFSLLINVSGGTNFYTDTILPATHYRYRVFAFNHAGLSGPSNEIELIPPADISMPLPPSNLTGVVRSPTSIALSWSDNSSDETGFVIFRSSGGPLTEIYRADANATAFVDNYVSQNSTYSYLVRSFNNVGASVNPSNTITITTPAPVISVVPPSDLRAAAITDKTASLFWVDNSADETSYVVRRINPNGSSVNLDLTADSTRADITGLQPLSTYRFVVLTNGNPLLPSNELVFTTLEGAPAILAAPVLNATPLSSSAINLNWTDPNTAEIGYELQRMNGANWIEVTSTGPSVTHFTDGGLTQGTRYYYRVRAVATNSPAFSNWALADAALAYPALEAPFLAATIISSSQINLSWTANDRAIGYRLQRSLNGTDSWVQIANLGQDAIAFEDRDLNSDTQYFYRVTAMGNPELDSSPSTVQSARTLGIQLSQPSLSANATSWDRIALTINDSNTAETGFTIERTGGGAVTQIPLGPNATTYSDTALIANTTYTYRITASASLPSLNSLPSNPVSATTLSNQLIVPAGLTASAISRSQINLAWSDSNSSPNEGGYKIERAEGNTFSWMTIQPSYTADSVSHLDQNGLKAGTTYFYRITALGVAPILSSPESTIASATTSPLTPPALSATSNSTSTILLAWANSGQGETAYRVEYSLNNSSWNALYDGNSSITSYSHTSLLTGQTYYYRIQSKVFSGSPSSWATANATTGILTPPTLSAAVLVPNQINLSWTASTEAIGYRLESSPDGAAFSLVSDTSLATTTSFTHTVIATGAPIYYRIRAKGVAGSYSAWSTTINAIPLAPAQLIFTSVSLSFGDIVVNSMGSLNATVKNIGGVSGSIASVSLAGADSASFTATNNCSGSVAVNATCTVAIMFVPQVIKTGYSAVLSLNGNTGTITGFGLSINGNGVRPAPTGTINVTPTVVQDPSMGDVGYVTLNWDSQNADTCRVNVDDFSSLVQPYQIFSGKSGINVRYQVPRMQAGHVTETHRFYLTCQGRVTAGPWASAVVTVDKNPH